MKHSRIICSLGSASRRGAMWLHRTRVQTVMAAWYFPERAGRCISAVRAMPRRRLAMTATVVAAIVVPSMLYVHERDRRLELSRAYGALTFSSRAEISTLRQTMGNLLTEQAELKGLLLEAGYAVYSDHMLSVPVVATGYSSTVWQTDSTPFTTAANTPTRQGIVALSRDLLTRYNAGAPFSFGDVVTISGVGDFIVEDSMHDRWRRRVDVWFPSRSAAVSFGRREVILRARVAPEGAPGGPATVLSPRPSAELASAAGASR